MRSIVIILFCFINLNGSAASGHKFDDTAKIAVSHVYNFRFKSLSDHLIVGSEKGSASTELNLILHQGYFYRSFFSEEKKDQLLMENLGLKILDKLNEAKEDFPLKNFFRSEVLLRSALIKIKHQQYLIGARDIHRAYKYLKSGYAKYPAEFIYLKNLGLLHACFGAIPEDFQWISGLLGFSGTVNQGLLELEFVMLKLKNSELAEIYGPETVSILAYLDATLLNEEHRSLDRIDLWNQTHNAAMTQLLKINLLSKFGRNDKVITTSLSLRPKLIEFHIYYLDFIIGVSKLYRLDNDASIFLENYVYGYRGNSLIKSACQKLAWNARINGQDNLYRLWMDQCIVRGNNFTDEDKEAQREASNGTVPHVELLKSRLLFDGGYYNKAIDLLSKIDIQSITTEREKIEFEYRKARANDRALNTNIAKKMYLTVIDLGRDKPYYFAANSALKLGEIYQDEKDTIQAMKYFELCIKLPKKEYRNSLDQKAKANISLLKAN